MTLCRPCWCVGRTCRGFARRHAQIVTRTASRDPVALSFLIANVAGFGLAAAGVLVYFHQYTYLRDRSDERWMYPLIWAAVVLALALAAATFLASVARASRVLLAVPVPSVVVMLLLSFLCYAFTVANRQSEKVRICGQSDSKNDRECVVLKDGTQACGHRAISRLCFQLDTGYGLILVACILMILLQYAFVIVACTRRTAIRNSSVRVCGATHCSGGGGGLAAAGDPSLQFDEMPLVLAQERHGHGGMHLNDL